MNLKQLVTGVVLGVVGATTLLPSGLVSAAENIQVYNKGQMIPLDAELVEATNALYKAKVTKLQVAETDYRAGATRWEASLLTKRFASTFKKIKVQNVNSCTFTDLTVNRDIAKEIVQACKIGLFKGHDGKFMPMQTFTRGQAVMVFARMLSNNPSMELNESYDYLMKEGIVHVDDRLNSNRPVPRSELYLIMYRMIKKIAENPEWGAEQGFNIQIIKDVFNSVDLDEKNGKTPVNPDDKKTTENDTKTDKEAEKILALTGNDVNVVANTVDDKVYTSDVIPTGASRIYLAKSIFKNTSNEQISIDSVDVKLRGLVSPRAVKKIALVNKDGVTVASANVQPDGTAKLMPNSYGRIDTNKTNEYYLAVDTSEDREFVGQNIQLEYTYKFDKERKVGGSLTGKTKEYRFVGYKAQVVSVEGYEGAVSKLYVGETNKLVGSFMLTAGARGNDSRQNIYLEKAILTNDGGRIEDKLKNVTLKIGDKVVSKDVTISRNSIVATFLNPTEQKNAQDQHAKDVKDGKATAERNSYGIERGDTVQVDIYADVVGGANGDKIKFYLKNTGDIQAKESGTNLPIGVKTVDPRYFKEFEIQAGKIVISKTAKSPVSESLSVNSPLTNVLSFQVSTPNALRMDEIEFKGTFRNRSTENVDIANVFKDIKVYKCTNDKEESCSSSGENLNVRSQTVAPSSTANFTVKGTMQNIERGATTYQLKIATERDAAKNVDFKFELDRTGFHNLTNNQDDRVTADSIVGSASSNFWSIGSTNLTVSYVNNAVLDYVKGKTGSYLGDIYISSPSKNNLKLNTIRLKFFDPAHGTDLHFDQLTNTKLTDKDGNVLGDIKTVESNGYVVFDNLNLSLPANGQVKLKVYTDIGANFYDTNVNKQFKFKVESNQTNDIYFTAGRGTRVESAGISGLPMESQAVTVHPTAKTYIYKDGEQPEGKVLYNTDGQYQPVLKFKLKSQYDDARIKDIYVVAWTGGAYSKDAGTAANINTNASNAVNSIRYKGASKTAEASLINGIARFTDISDTLEANKEKPVEIALQVANINNIASDNQALQMAVVLKITANGGQVYETKIISNANGNVLNNSTDVDLNDELISTAQTVRKTMIEVTTPTNELTRTIVNGSDASLYQLNIRNLGKSKAKVKQIALPVTINNTGAPLTLANLKLEVSNNGGRSFRSWSEMRNHVEFALLPEATPLTSANWQSGSAINLSAAANGNYMLYARFVGSYANGYDVDSNQTIALRVKANVTGADNNSDSISIEARTQSTTNTMAAYSTFEAGADAKNTVVWTDNADEDGNTSTTDANWFNDNGVENRYNTNALSYRA